MRTLLTLILVLALFAGAIAAYLVLTTPEQAAGVRFPLPAPQRALVGRVPASADAFALLPTAGPLERKLRANAVLRQPLEQWTESQPIPGPWLLGDADVVVWRDGKETSYAIRVDAIRAFLVRTWMLWSTDVDARWDGTAFVINGRAGAPIAAADLDSLLAVASGLPSGDLLVVQRNRQRGAYPPIARPAVTSVAVSPKEILITSRARPAAGDGGTEAVAGSSPPSGRRPVFPRGAMIAATFIDPPRLIGDLRRLVGLDVDALVSGGGSLILYDVDTGTLLPRPRGLVSVPADQARRTAWNRVSGVAELVGKTRDTGKDLLASFDGESLDLYLMDTFVPATLPSTSWAVRIDPGKLVPVLEKLGDSTGLRLASGRLHRGARDLRRWISPLSRAGSIEAGASRGGGMEELRVRIASK